MQKSEITTMKLKFYMDGLLNSLLLAKKDANFCNNEFEKTTLCLTKVFKLLGQIAISKQTLFHSYLPFLDFLSQVMQICKFA
jgi:hypothetical protein